MIIASPDAGATVNAVKVSMFVLAVQPVISVAWATNPASVAVRKMSILPLNWSSSVTLISVMAVVVVGVPDTVPSNMVSHDSSNLSAASVLVLIAPTSASIRPLTNAAGNLV